MVRSVELGQFSLDKTRGLAVTPLSLTSTIKFAQVYLITVVPLMAC